MDARLQRRVQRYGWDLATAAYETRWQAQLAGVQAELLALAALVPGEQVLDVACGTGLVSYAAARAVGRTGRVCGVDLSGAMVRAAQVKALQAPGLPVSFERMDAESLVWPEASFDVVLCALGLMYMPEPEQALREMRRVLRPGGRLVVAVWGERARCGWAALFPIVDAEVASEVCPLFFRLGQPGAPAGWCAETGLVPTAQQRLRTTLNHPDADDACEAAFVAGPVALAWSRFDAATRERVRARYVEAIAPFRTGKGYRIPAEFVVVSAVRAA
ncbi:MAG: class I SAM-dependent methyltransferase [Rubrivivax sp.]|nr:class I SAM-dependent methyltransferase [Rubrivivax sp.]